MSFGLDELVDPRRCALITSELQQGVVGEQSMLPELSVAATPAVYAAGRLCEAARSAGVPVIHCTASRREDGLGSNGNARLFAALAKQPVQLVPGSQAAELMPQLNLADGDLVLTRTHGLSPMAGTDLEPVLRNLGVSSLVVTGVSTNVAIPNLVMDAVNRGFEVVIATDAVAGVPAEYSADVLRYTLGLLATMTESTQIIEHWSTLK